MPIVKIIELNQEVDIATGETVLRGAMAHGIHFGFVCGGNAACGTCLIKVADGLETLPPRNQKEDFLSKAMMLEPEYRLGCQTTIGPVNLLISIPAFARKQAKT